MAKKPIKPATEDEVLEVMTTAVNALSRKKPVRHLTMLGVLAALTVEQENLFWLAQTQERARLQAEQDHAPENGTVDQGHRGADLVAGGGEDQDQDEPED